MENCKIQSDLIRNNKKIYGIGIFETLEEADLESPETIAEKIGKVLIQCMEAGAKPFVLEQNLAQIYQQGLIGFINLIIKQLCQTGEKFQRK